MPDTYPKPLDIVSVKVTLGLDTSHSAPPYNVDTCSIKTMNRALQEVTRPGWGLDDIGTVAQEGAQFMLTIQDNNPAPAQSVARWALTWLPRGDNPPAKSPFGINVTTISGAGSSAGVTADQKGTRFELTVAATDKIKSGAGDWDWSAMIQMVCAAPVGVTTGPVTKCFGSDPEMKVDA